ncbi:MAG: hypothetical protein HQL86_06160 [Magnetococcales bacterium]|nr:hypothetical protein [Magnetococcales bacterium]
MSRWRQGGITLVLLLLAVMHAQSPTLGMIEPLFVTEAVADASLPPGAVPMGTANAEAAAQGRAAEEQEQMDNATRRFKEFRNFLIIWVVMMLVGFMAWKMRPRAKWTPPEPAKPEEPVVEVEVEELPGSAVESAVLTTKAIPSDDQRRRTRDNLISLAMEWEDRYGLLPIQSSVIAARDAALLVGMSDERYSLHMQDRVVPAPNDVDFIYNKQRYIVRCARIAPGTEKVYVSKAHQGSWNYLVFILYDAKFSILGAWQMPNDLYQVQCGDKERLTPEDHQVGKNLLNGAGIRMT